jgi:hypothetical protein
MGAHPVEPIDGFVIEMADGGEELIALRLLVFHPTDEDPSAGIPALAFVLLPLDSHVAQLHQSRLLAEQHACVNNPANASR